jgi:hypothetical protein
MWNSHNKSAMKSRLMPGGGGDPAGVVIGLFRWPSSVTHGEQMQHVPGQCGIVES